LARNDGMDRPKRSGRSRSTAVFFTPSIDSHVTYY
jgi:hypothetical protein